MKILPINNPTSPIVFGQNNHPSNIAHKEPKTSNIGLWSFVGGTFIGSTFGYIYAKLRKAKR